MFIPLAVPPPPPPPPPPPVYRPRVEEHPHTAQPTHRFNKKRNHRPCVNVKKLEGGSLDARRFFFVVRAVVTSYCQKTNRSHAYAHNSRTHDSRTNHSHEHRASNGATTLNSRSRRRRPQDRRCPFGKSLSPLRVNELATGAKVLRTDPPVYCACRQTHQGYFRDVFPSRISALGSLWDWGRIHFCLRVESLPGDHPNPPSGPILDPTADREWTDFFDMLGGWVNPHRGQQTIPQGQTSSPPKSFFTPRHAYWPTRYQSLGVAPVTSRPLSSGCCRRARRTRGGPSRQYGTPPRYEQALVCLSNKEIVDASRGCAFHCKMANNRVTVCFQIVLA